VLRPIATGYRDWVPGELREPGWQFLRNTPPADRRHNMLQGKFEDGFLDWMRFGFKQHLRLLGLHDIAATWLREAQQISARPSAAGGGDRAYLVLPLLGSSKRGDGFGSAARHLPRPAGECAPLPP